jgi:hypothetical protein
VTVTEAAAAPVGLKNRARKPVAVSWAITWEGPLNGACTVMVTAFGVKGSTGPLQ